MDGVTMGHVVCGARAGWGRHAQIGNRSHHITMFSLSTAARTRFTHSSTRTHLQRFNSPHVTQVFAHMLAAAIALSASTTALSVGGMARSGGGGGQQQPQQPPPPAPPAPPRDAQQPQPGTQRRQQSQSQSRDPSQSAPGNGAQRRSGSRGRGRGRGRGKGRAAGAPPARDQSTVAEAGTAASTARAPKEKQAPLTHCQYISGRFEFMGISC